MTDEHDTLPTVQVLNLGYLGVQVPDIDAWMTFGRDVLGAEMSTSEDGTTGYMKTDERVWRVAFHQGERGNVAYLGFEVQGPRELRRAQAVLKAHGVDSEWVDGDRAAERKVAELVRLRDPASNLVEIFYGQYNDYSFRSPLGVSRFVTGPQGLGHAVLGVGDLDATVDFYLDVFGFAISDLAVQGKSRTIFLRCGAREHTLALFDTDPARAPKLHHFMLEVGELDDVGMAYDRVFDHEVPLTLTLGRHTNDSMVSFYCKSPAGFQIEYGWQGRQMTPSDAATTMVKGDVWGHRFVDGKSVNELIKKK
ncbi:VOC family protein [Jatrophihabitans fulvus]